MWIFVVLFCLVSDVCLCSNIHKGLINVKSSAESTISVDPSCSLLILLLSYLNCENFALLAKEKKSKTIDTFLTNGQLFESSPT